MSSNSWNQTLVTAQVDGTALVNTTTATSLLPTAAKFVLPSNLFQIGTKLALRASGRISSAGSSPGTFTWDVRFGSTVVFNGGASGILAVSGSNLTWDLDVTLTCRSIGSTTTATVIGTGKVLSAIFAAATPVLLLPASSPAIGTGFDSTASQTVDLFGTWSVANASNTIAVHQYELTLLN